MKKNILVVDDSALMRRVISDIINSDDRFQVCETVTNGLEALDILIKEPQKYDVIILDINMPKMNGLEFLKSYMKLRLRAKVIVVSTVAVEGTKETIQALELGAFDFVTKPTSFIEVKSESFKEKLLQCMRAALGIRTMEKEKISNIDKPKNLHRNYERKSVGERSVIKGKKLVALACSTGGPKALQSVVPYLPEKLDAPMLIVQHMPEGFTKSLADRLDDMSKIKVKEAEDGEQLEKGIVYIAKGGRQMRVLMNKKGEYQISLSLEPARNGLKPCADIMYESLVDSAYDEITCVVLTGMGGDGTQGIKQLKETNNVYSIAQDEKTCTVYGMPKVLITNGLADEVVPLTKVADAIVRKVGVQ